MERGMGEVCEWHLNIHRTSSPPRSYQQHVYSLRANRAGEKTGNESLGRPNKSVFIQVYRCADETITRPCRYLYSVSGLQL